ncbi:MAG: tyrosine-type recombinase/integrase [candidate division WOR-3 bacterium]
MLPIPSSLKNQIKLVFSLWKSEDRFFDYTKVTLWRRIKEIGKRLGIELRPHTLRHTFATEMLRKGANIRVIQKVLRHSSLATTQILYSSNTG